MAWSKKTSRQHCKPLKKLVECKPDSSFWSAILSLGAIVARLTKPRDDIEIVQRAVWPFALSPHARCKFVLLA
jgi:hypothetical protein